MDDQKLLRYSRQIQLPEIDVAGQQRLLDSTVAMFGLGGLGSPAAMYLASSGIGKLILVDPDYVDLSNLQRQIVHATQSIGLSKTESAAATLAALNPEIELVGVNTRQTGETLRALVRGVDVVVDGTDNFTSRFEINQACVLERRALVSGSVLRFEGQVAVFNLRDPRGPCYRCLFTEQGEAELRCSETGILGPVAGIVGSILATETIKFLLNLGVGLSSSLLSIDAKQMSFRSAKIPKDPKCPVCSRTA